MWLPLNEHLENERQNHVEAHIRKHLREIANASGIPAAGDGSWNIRMISWTGLEWAGMGADEGLCYVDVFYHAHAPQDFLFVLETRGNDYSLVAAYQRQLAQMVRYMASDRAVAFRLPEEVPWRILAEHQARKGPLAKDVRQHPAGSVWVAGRCGFYALSLAADGRSFFIQARLRQDLENLREIGAPGDIECTMGKAEYPWLMELRMDFLWAVLTALMRCSGTKELPEATALVPSQQGKSHAYAMMERELLKLQFAEWESMQDSEHFFNMTALDTVIRRDIKKIAKQSSLAGVDEEPWDVTRISWTGEEWPELQPHFGYCYVEAFEHSVPPHDYLYVVGVRTGEPEFIAVYEGDIGYFDLTVSRPEADALALPERVSRQA